MLLHLIINRSNLSLCLEHEGRCNAVTICAAAWGSHVGGQQKSCFYFTFCVKHFFLEFLYCCTCIVSSGLGLGSASKFIFALDPEISSVGPTKRYSLKIPSGNSCKAPYISYLETPNFAFYCKALIPLFCTASCPNFCSQFGYPQADRKSRALRPGKHYENQAVVSSFGWCHADKLFHLIQQCKMR